jgi:hypothetical protein
MPLPGAPPPPGTVPWWNRDIMGYQPGTGGSPSPPVLGSPATPATPGVTGISYGDIMKLLLSSGGNKQVMPAATPATPMGSNVNPVGVQAGQGMYNQLWQPKQQGGSTGAILSALGPALFA